MNNTGYKEPEVKEEDYVLGGLFSAPQEVVLESGDWRPHLPEGEIQRRGIFDTNSCTNFGWLNMVEILLNFKFQDKRNFSERFMAVVSEQARNGNDPHRVAEAIRKKGMVEEFLLPFVDGMNWETYFSPNPMSKNYLKQGRLWLGEYGFKHEYITKNWMDLSEQEHRLTEALKRSPVGIAVYAWEKRGDLFVRPQGAPDTHWTVLVGYEKNYCWYVYDSYSEDGEYIKKLAWDYPIKISKGFYIGLPEPSWWEKLLKTLFSWYN